MINDPMSWMFLLVACVLIVGGLLANGLRLSRLDVKERTENRHHRSAEVLSKDLEEIDSKYSDFLLRRGVALSVGTFGVMILLSLAPSLNERAAELESSAMGFGAVAVFFFILALCVWQLNVREGG